MTELKTWFENAWWSWGNCISFRFDKYEDNIDRCAFFEEINCGWYEMYIYDFDDWYNPTISPERQLRLGQRPKPPSIAIDTVIGEPIRSILDETKGERIDSISLPTELPLITYD